MFKGDQEDVKLRFQNRFADAVIDEFGKDIILAPVELSPPWLFRCCPQLSIIFFLQCKLIIHQTPVDIYALKEVYFMVF